MNIGVSSYSFSKYMKETGCNYLAICDLAKKMGYNGIEFIDLKEEVAGCAPMEAARQIREHCAKIGLDVVAYTVAANFLSADPAAEVARVEALVDQAEALGAPVMRHDCCWGPREGVARYTWRDAIEEVAPYIRQVTEYAETKGIRTCTENHGTFIQDSNRVETLIRTVNHKNYGWLVDMGNFLCADEDSVHALATALPYAFHVHVKDFLRKKASEVNPGIGWFRTRGGDYIRGTVVGNGVIPVVSCLHMIKSFGYQGYLSVEFEGMEDNLTALKAGLDYIHRVVD